jgi:DNA-binding MarR family transcriptional regulator
VIRSTKPTTDRTQRRLLLGLAQGMRLNEAALQAGISIEEARKRIRSIRYLIASNDSSIDDFLREAEAIDSSIDIRSPDLQPERENPATKKRSLLEGLLENLEPEELRDVAHTLLKIADAVDQDWHPEKVRSAYRWPSGAAKIERNSLRLAKHAKAILRFRRERTKTIPADLFGEPAWEMLLELFCQFAGGAAVSLKSITIASGAPQTTALRQIDKLESEGLIKRRPSTTDGRVTLIELTKDGVLAVGRALEQYA